MYYASVSAFNSYLLAGILTALGESAEAIGARHDADKLFAESKEHLRKVGGSSTAGSFCVDVASELAEIREAWKKSGNREGLAMNDEVAIRALDEAEDVAVGFVAHERGRAYRSLEQWDKAIAAYSKAIELDGKNLLLLENRASLYLRLGLWDKAIADYSKILNVQPDHAEARNNLAWLLATCIELKLRDPNRAVDLAKKAVASSPRDANSWNMLGVAQYRAGDWKAAITALEKSMELRKGGDSFDWFFLAMGRYQLGDKKEARKWYGQAVEWQEKNQPKNEELVRFRAEAETLMKIERKPVPK
jgi:tetratricopeptide (TPR) repeat protein